MTQRDRMLQWAAYGIALLLILGVETLLLSRLPFRGTLPVLLPLALAACATLEGPRAGAGFGIAVGILMAVAAGGGFWRIPLCSAAGMGVGLIARYVLHQDFMGHLVCSALLLFCRMLWCIGIRLFLGVADLATLFSVGL